MNVVVDSGRLSSALAGGSLVDMLLDEQQDLSAVEEFARWHESEPENEHSYSALIPAAPPAAGQQYAFQVDLQACSGCKACVVACHERNGLDENETWREVGLIYGGTSQQPVLQHVTTACHHCLEPACLLGCPVKAYEKDPVTGIVHHLDDQCIGCQYCIFACPFDVPKYNTAKGIVRKCDMCSGRLAVGEPPACVQACPNEAIRITIVSTEQAASHCAAGSFLPGAPDPRLTLPTTKYISRPQTATDLKPGNYYSVNPEHAHWPLIVMLVLTQAAVGTLTIQSLLDWATDASVGLGATSLGVALIIQVAALVASVFHLGRPHLAFRAVLGLRTSWLSREILTFGGFTAVLATYWFASFTDIPSVISMPLQAASLAMGWAGVFCSAMVYIVTRRDFWNASATFAKFLLTSVVLGIAVSLLLLSWSERYSFSSVGAIACGCVVVSTLLKSAVELSVLRHLRGPDDRTLKRSALLLTGELGPTFKVRLICALAGGISLPIAWLTLAGDQPVGQFLPAAVSVAAVAVLLSGELLERYLFFTAVVAPRMPRGL